MSIRLAGVPARAAPIVAAGLTLTAAYVVAVVWAMEKADYDLWMTILLAPVLILITLPALRRQATREGDYRLVRILTWALIFKLGASLLRFHVAFGLYGGVADATGYHDWGIDIAANIRSLDLQTGLPDLHRTPTSSDS